MRILVHSIFYSPELTGVAKYTAEMCEWLAAQGHEVEVVAPPPHYPQWRLHAPYHQWRYTAENIRGVHVRRCPLWLPRSPRGLGRVLYTLSFSLFSLPTLFFAVWKAPDVILSIEPPLLGSIAVWLAARWTGAAAWLHIQDFEIDLAYDLGQLRRGRRLAGIFESWVLRRFDAVSSITLRMLARAHTKGVEATRLVLLSNWFNPAEVRPLPYPSPLRAELGIDKAAQVVLFSGSLGAKQGLDILVEAARQTSGNVEFVICGEGVEAARLRELSASLRNLRFLPLQPADRLNELLNLADVHFLPQDPNAAISVMPSKLIGMLASGRPVVATVAAGSEIAELVDGCGIRVDPGDVSGVVRALAALEQDAAMRIRLGENARKRAEELFSVDRILPAFERDLNRLGGSVTRNPDVRLASE
jgi:colanic acid biosynthesis glycosyl transferase WcaI